jgi:hypothetical protein
MIGEVEILPQIYHRIRIPARACVELESPLAPEAVRDWIASLPRWLEIRHTGRSETGGEARSVGPQKCTRQIAAHQLLCFAKPSRPTDEGGLSDENTLA